MKEYQIYEVDGGGTVDYAVISFATLCKGQEVKEACEKLLTGKERYT